MKVIPDRFPPEDYNRIINQLLLWFELERGSVPPERYRMWRKQIKRLFIAGFTVEEILGAFEEASQKKNWPRGRKNPPGFFTRVRDIVLKNRRYTRPTLAYNKGFEDFSTLLKGRGLDGKK